MVVSAAICVVLPVFIFFFWRKKYNLKAIPLLCGIAVWIMFAYILQSIMHGLVLERTADGTIKLLNESPRLYVIYAILAAGIFEESGRFIAFKLIRKRHNDIGTGISYGLGHGGIEATMLVGLLMINYILFSTMVNSGNTAAFGDDIDILAPIGVLQDTPSVMFLVGGIERIMALAVHISLSIVVLCSVVKKDVLWLYPVAIVLHAAVNLAPAMFQAKFFDNIWLVEILILLPTALCVYAAIKCCRFMTQEEPVEVDV